MYEANKPVLRLCILGVLVSCLWLISKQGSRSQVIQNAKEIPINVVQLEPQNAPVEIRCNSHQGSLGVFDGFSCDIKNNTTKDLSGITLKYSVLRAGDTGSADRDTSSLTMNALIHPDLREIQKRVGPGEEGHVTTPIMTYESSVVIRAIEVSVDFVEFDDGTWLGPNEYGSKIMAGLREGAALYKDWLVRQYLQKGKSIPETVSLLESDQSLPNNIGQLRLNQGDRGEGARMYRVLLRKLRQAKGDGELQKVLNNISSSNK